MGAHMLPGRERWRAMRRSMRFTFAAILAVPLLALAAIWGFAGVTIGEAIANRQTPQHGTVLIRIAVADVLGLLAVLFSAAAMTWFSRRLARDVASLDASARRFADQQLPQMVERLHSGDRIDPERELPPAARAQVTDLARAAAALASVQRAAVTATAAEASLRAGTSEVFASLARRSQSLLQRQLSLLDDLERKAPDPAALADLFPLDHLTTQMRRHAEGLIILSGAVPGRAWSNPVPVIDVIRGAMAEIEGYRRVAVVSHTEDAVAGSAAVDMIHLLAELIENAAVFSPSGSRVEVRAQRLDHGYAVEVEDRGPGIEPGALDAINERLGAPTGFDLADADRLGLFVVATLAGRHGVRVFLRPSARGGTTAIVVMPLTMITADAGAAPAAAKPVTPADRAERAGPGEAGPRPALTRRSLPRRVRQASLSPNLRDGRAREAEVPASGPGVAAEEAGGSVRETSPEEA